MLSLDQLQVRLEILEEQQARQLAGGGPTSFGASTVVWRPGSVSSGNVFATWAEIVATVSKMQGDVTIDVDMSIAPAIILAGAWDLRPAGVSGRVTLVGAGKGFDYFNQTVTIANAVVTIHGLSGLDNVQVVNQSTVDLITLAHETAFRLSGYAAIFQSVTAGATHAFIRATSFGAALELLDESFVSTLDGGTNALQANAGAVLQITIFGNASIDTNQLVAPVNTAIVIVWAVPTPGFVTYATQVGAPTIFPNGLRQKGSNAIDGATGKSLVIAAFVSATTRIECTQRTPVGDATTVRYAALVADRVNGNPGTFKIAALTAAGTGAVNAGDSSLVDWEVID